MHHGPQYPGSPSMTRLLLVEDDKQFSTAITISLRARGYEVTIAGGGREALARFGSEHFEAVVLDLGLGDIDGIEVITEIRKVSSTPILVLSARHGEVSKIDALDAGADDYVTKPFGLGEFLARLRATIRRGTPSHNMAKVMVGPLTIDLAAKMLLDATGTQIKLTPTEWSLLEVLALENNQLVARSDLLFKVWGPSHKSEFDYLRVYVAQLRRKLEPNPGSPRYLITETGVGYRLLGERLE